MKEPKDPNKNFTTFRHLRTDYNGNITICCTIYPNKKKQVYKFFISKIARTIPKCIPDTSTAIVFF